MRSESSSPPPTIGDALRQLWRLAHIIRPYWRSLVTGIVLGILIGLVGLILPYLSKLLIDDVYPTRDLSLMHALVVTVTVVTFVSSIMGALRGYYAQSISVQLSTATTLLFFNHLQHLPVRFFDEHRVGEVMSRFGDVRSALGTLSSVLQTILGSGVYLLVVPPFLFLINYKLALLSVATLPITTTISVVTGRALRDYWKRSAEASSELSAVQMEAFSHIRAMKTIAAEHRLYATARDQAHLVARLQLTASGASTVIGVGNGLLRAIGTAAFTWYAWTLILRGEMSLGDFIAFSAYLGYLTGPAGKFAGLFSSLQQSAVTLGRMFEYLDETPEQDPTTAYAPPPPLRRARGELRFDDVSFGYAADRAVLRNVSLTCHPGTVTAIVGPSGAGKSSLLRLATRFGEPTAGRLTLDGAPLTSLPLHEFRRNVAVVWQEFAVLRGTVWDNLTYGSDPDPLLEDRVHAAIRVCQLDDVIRDLPDGLETPVAEWGATLSGGQRQRIAIARAIVQDRPVLLLDEATSQVDTATEEALLRALFSTMGDRTVLLVTHRIATAALADQICVLQAGQVAGVGHHTELVASCDAYRRLLRAAGDPQRGAALHRLQGVGA